MSRVLIDTEKLLADITEKLTTAQLLAIDCPMLLIEQQRAILGILSAAISENNAQQPDYQLRQLHHYFGQQRMNFVQDTNRELFDICNRTVKKKLMTMMCEYLLDNPEYIEPCFSSVFDRGASSLEIELDIFFCTTYRKKPLLLPRPITSAQAAQQISLPEGYNARV